MTLREKIESNLEEDEYIFDASTTPTVLIREMAKKGKYPVCHRCGARLEFALSPMEARSKGVPPGVRCPKNLNHCQIIVGFAKDPTFWQGTSGEME